MRVAPEDITAEEAAKQAWLAKQQTPSWTGQSQAAQATSDPPRLTRLNPSVAILEQECDAGQLESCKLLAIEDEANQAWPAQAKTWSTVATAAAEVAMLVQSQQPDMEQAKRVWLARLDAQTWHTAAFTLAQVAKDARTMEMLDTFCSSGDEQACNLLSSEDDAKRAWLSELDSQTRSAVMAAVAEMGADAPAAALAVRLPDGRAFSMDRGGEGYEENRREMIKAMRALKQFMRQQAQVHPDEQELIARGEQFQKEMEYLLNKDVERLSVPLNRAPPVPQIPQAPINPVAPAVAPQLPKAPLPPAAPQDRAMASQVAVAEYEWRGDGNVDRLSFVAGDRISVIEAREAGGWWLGSLNGQRGWFPSAYCRIEDSAAPPTRDPEPPAPKAPMGLPLTEAKFEASMNARKGLAALDASRSITDEPERKGRFSKAWETLEKDEKNAKWLSSVMDRTVDAIDDSLCRSSYIKERSANRGPGGSVPRLRPRVVVLGSGWGANAVLSQLKNADVDLTVISPRNFFLFTPMLAGAALGTLEPRSIIQPIREANPYATYYEAEAEVINLAAKTVTCESVECNGLPEGCDIKEFDIPYDKLIVAVGASTNTFGVKGVKEYCLFMKQISDAVLFRQRLGFAFEQASLPGLTDAERTQLLTFVVIGSGPTGVELCGELRDFVAQDVPRLYAGLAPFVRLVLLTSSNKVLKGFDSDLQNAALNVLTSNARGVSIDVRLNAGVQEVTESEVILSDGSAVPYSLALWAAGIGTLDFVRETSEAIGPAQTEHDALSRGRLAVDEWMRVYGAPDVFAFGDCAHVVSSPYPATAQVAAQAGTYLGRLIADGYDFSVDGPPRLHDGAPGERTLRHKLSKNRGVAPPFSFLNLGILAYLGASEALVEIAVGEGEERKIKGAGEAGFALWRSVYLSKQFGLRNRFLVSVDWVKARLFGRDLSRLE